MAPGFRKFCKRFFILLNITVVVLFLFACVAAYTNPGKFWLIGMLGVGFVFFLAAVVIFLLFWLLLRSKWAWLSFIALIIGLSQIYAVFGWHFFTAYDSDKPNGPLRIMQWNVSNWDENNKAKRNGVSYRQEMFNYIAEQDADVLCFQEFFNSEIPRNHNENVSYITNKLLYPYHYFAIDATWWTGELQFGTAIFSRYPIVDSARTRYPSYNKKPFGESLIRVTIDINGQKVNIFTTHLQSFLFKGQDYENIEILKSPEGNKGRLLSAGKGIMSKFRNAYKARFVQAEMVRKELDKSEYPSIITGDFNDVPNSYTYFTIKGNYQDAFIKKGSGIGRTFFSISPTLRIDYILADKSFEILQYKRDLRPFSDHYPLVSDIIISDPKSQ